MGLFDGGGVFGSGNLFGGNNSIFNSPGQIFGGSNSIFNKPFGSKPADPAPPPPPPDPSTATTDALNNQLQQELQMRRSNSLATSGEGVFGSPSVQSAGQLLLGS